MLLTVKIISPDLTSVFRVERQQLADIFRVMQENSEMSKEVNSVEQVQQQMSLYKH